MSFDDLLDADRRETEARDHHWPARRLRGCVDQGCPPLPPAWSARRAAARCVGLPPAAQNAIDLVKIKTLAEAGVPLARVKELLTADPDQFAAAIAEIDRSLQQRAEELLRTRERIAQLRGGDRLFVSAEVADYLDRLHQLGVSRRAVQMERDLWILHQSVSPKAAAIWIADKRDAIDDPEFCAIYLEYDAAFDWSPGDPRLPALADRTQRWLANRHHTSEHAAPPIPDPIIAQLVTASAAVSSPAWDRLTEIAQQRRTGG